MTGRPSTYSQEVVGAICERIALGESLRAICRDDAMPAMSTVFKWLTEQPTFSEQYARAREEQAESMADEIVSIADNAEDAAKARLQIDARKWVASKLKPKKYGDKTTAELTIKRASEELGDDELAAIATSSGS